jgi:hypothetical protein
MPKTGLEQVSWVNFIVVYRRIKKCERKENGQQYDQQSDYRTTLLPTRPNKAELAIHQQSSHPLLPLYQMGDFFLEDFFPTFVLAIEVHFISS